ncbi:hypothetical protein ABZ915_04675 [Streptomyces sp. NPDC046915]|uniref:hypothetical protein n=1 Tax=Streptomyces sp. NPDC046915 TaxID=3155257 RepID=UPI0033D046FB
MTGAQLVARDVVQNLLAEIARTRPGTPVTVLRGTADAPPLAVPPTLHAGLARGRRTGSPVRPRVAGWTGRRAGRSPADVVTFRQRAGNSGGAKGVCSGGASEPGGVSFSAPGHLRAGL